MNTGDALVHRLQIAQRRRALLARQSIIVARHLHWQAMVRGAAALSRDYCQDDHELAKYFTDLTVRGVVRERECVAELASLKLQIEGLTREISLINSDDWREQKLLNEFINQEARNE